MSWEKCEREFIRKVEVDNEKINSIITQTKERIKRIKLTEKENLSISLIVEDYYEVIKELLVAYLLKNGLRSRNHQCLFSYFYKINPNFEKETYLISQMSLFRNRLCYYGEKIPEEFYKNNKEEFNKIIKLILSLINKSNNSLKNSNI